MNAKIERILDYLAPTIFEIVVILVALVFLVLTNQYDFTTWYIIGVPTFLISFILIFLIIMLISKVIKKLKKIK